MLAVGLQRHQVDHVDDADFQLGQVLAATDRPPREFPGSERRRRRPSPRPARFRRVVAGPIPDTDAPRRNEPPPRPPSAIAGPAAFPR